MSQVYLLYLANSDKLANLVLYGDNLSPAFVLGDMMKAFFGIYYANFAEIDISNN